MNKISFKKIGVIHTPFKNTSGMPIQAAKADGVCGTVEIFQDYVEGLKDLDGFSHIILIYHFHMAKKTELTVTPFLDTKPHGVFSTRAPLRPNHIGISVVKLVGVNQNILSVENIDVLDNTPLLDIKPYIPEFDHHEADRIGWLAESSHKNNEFKSDARFDTCSDKQVDVCSKAVHITLKKSCIGTQAKLEYEKLLSQYMKKSLLNQNREELNELENSIEILKFFLENTDFGKLRNDYPQLRGGTETPVNVMISSNMLLVNETETILMVS